MNKTTFYNRLGKAGLLKKSGELQVRYCGTLSELICGYKVRPVWTRGYGSLDRASVDRAEALISALKLSYETGNDTPRGGATGEFICLSKKGIKQLEGLSIKYKGRFEGGPGYVITFNED